MAPGTATFTLVVRVDATTPAGTTLANAARVFAAAVDPNPADNDVTTSTAVIRVADLAIVSQTLIDPPSRVLVGAPATVSLRKVVTNHGPSAPVDAAIAVTASAPLGSTVSPMSVGLAEPAIGLEEQRTIVESFSVTCGAPGSQTFVFANAISPADGTTTDPNPSNDTATTSLAVDCIVPVAINIRPHGSPNPVNLRSQATLAVLTTAAGEYGLPLAFDATTIDPTSVRFGPADVVFAGLGGASEVHHKGHPTDSYELDETTRDGDLDLVLHFRADESGLTTTSTEGCVAGTFAGPGGTTLGFFGCDTVVVRP